jgi:hypothetical protein
MEQEVDVQEVLKHMRDSIGLLTQENAILKSQLAKLTADS